MVENRSGLDDCTLEELRRRWDEADDKGHDADGFSAGEIVKVIQRKAEISQPKKPERRIGIASPIDSSIGMRGVTRIGMQRARSKQ